MTINELKITSYLYSKFSNEDKNYKNVFAKNLDLTQKNDTAILLKFLRDWGCRQFKKEDENISSKSMKGWFVKHHSQFPKINTSLTDISEKKIDSFAGLFNDLMNCTACIKNFDTKEIKTNVGPVGAAKTLFALRKNTFAPWDNPIIKKFHYSTDGKGYCDYLKKIKNDLMELKSFCIKHNIDFKTLPAILGRPNSSLPKMIDEYLWVSITRKCKPEELLQL